MNKSMFDIGNVVVFSSKFGYRDILACFPEPGCVHIGLGSWEGRVEPSYCVSYELFAKYGLTTKMCIIEDEVCSMLVAPNGNSALLYHSPVRVENIGYLRQVSMEAALAEPAYSFFPTLGGFYLVKDN